MKPIASTQDLMDTLDAAKAERLLTISLTAEKDAEIAAIQNRFSGKIKAAEDNEKAYLKLAQGYATEHRAELLPKGKKSALIGPHELGWEDNGGSIKTRRGMTEKKVIAKLIKARGQFAKLFIRHTPALDKPSIAAKWSVWGAKLKAFGLTYTHEEIFFVKLDITQPENARVTPQP